MVQSLRCTTAAPGRRRASTLVATEVRRGDDRAAEASREQQPQWREGWHRVGGENNLQDKRKGRLVGNT